MVELKIKPEFRDKIPPLTEDEFSRLEKSILEDGEVRDPIVVWDDVIVDGHNRYKIVQAHPEIPFKVKQMDFSDEYAAIVWMCKNQLGRRNITDEQKTVLIGEAYKAQKMSRGGDRGTNKDKSGRFSASAQNEHLRPMRTSDRIAKEFGVAKETVKRSEHFLDGLNAADAVSPGIKDSILSGEVKAPKSAIAAIRNISEEQRTAAVEAIKRGETPEPPKKDGRKGYSTKMREENKIISSVVSGLYDGGKPVEHTVDHFLEDLSAMAEDFTKKLERSFEIFSATLDESGAKEKVACLISDFVEKVEKTRREHCD